MSHRIRRHFPTVAIALVAGMVGANAPAIAHGVHAAFAHNADKVDGIHAVKANAANKNKKLVATTAAGMFPLSVIPKADAETLDGQDSSAFAPSTHGHSGADITSGAVDEARIDPDLTRDSELASHDHDSTYVKLSPSSSQTIGNDITFTGNILRVTGLMRMGSETGPAEVPTATGLIVRRVKSSTTADGTVVAAVGDGGNQSTIQRDGTLGGLKFVAANTFHSLTCLGVTSSGGVLGRSISSSAGPIQTIFANTDNVVSVTCTYGNTTGPGGDSTELTMHRETISTGSNSWIGSMITSTNQ